MASAASNPQLIELTAASDQPLTAQADIMDGGRLYKPNGTAPHALAPHVDVVVDTMGYSSSLSNKPTHISSRRTFAGGIVRYITTPNTVLVSGADQQPPRSPLAVARGVLSECQRRDWWLRQSPFQLHLFADVALWKAAMIELLGTMLLTFMVLVIVTGILNHKEDYSYFPTAIAVWHIPLIAFMILATATTSGGRQTHMHI